MTLFRVSGSISRCLEILAVILLAAIATAGADPVLDMADSLMGAGFYDDAVTEYRRFLFFNESPKKRSPVYSRLGYCYAYLGDRDAAVDALSRAIDFAENDSLALQYRIDRAVVFAATNDIVRAGIELEEIIAGADSRALKKRAGMLLFMVRVLQHDWPTARIIYDRFLRNESYHSDSIKRFLDRAVNDRYKSPGKAMLLSTIFPGAGQIYNGHWLSGLNALALNLALGYLTVDLVSDREYVPAFLSYIFLFQRYYSGNRGSAYQQAVAHNRQQDLQYENEILSLLKQIVTPKAK